MQRLTDNFITMIHHLRTISSQMKMQTDITFGEFCVLSIINTSIRQNSEKPTPTQLNDLLKTKKPATSRMLAVLEKKGYIQRYTDESDHRISYLCLSSEGESVLALEQHAFEGFIERIAAKMGTEEILQMEILIRKLILLLEEEETVSYE